jgi:hypothetical protein
MNEIIKTIISSVASVIMICLVFVVYPGIIPTFKVRIEVDSVGFPVRLQNYNIPIRVENHQIDVKAKLETGFIPLKVEACTGYPSNFKIQVQ